MNGSLLEYLTKRLGRRPGADPVTDADLLDRYTHAADQGAFAELVARYGPTVWGVCRRALADEHRAEDAFQATFLVLARDAGRIRRPASVASWLFGVARRLARKAGSRPDRHGEPAAEPYAHPDPAGDLSHREACRALDEEVTRLPEALRAPVLLCYYEGLTQDEAARRLGWKRRTVKARIARARTALHAALTRRGVELSAVLLAVGTAKAVHPRPTATPSSDVVQLAGGLTVGRPVGPAWAALSACVALIGVGGLLLAGKPAGDDPPPDRPSDPPAAMASLRLGTPRFRHDHMQDLLFLPDGKTLVSVSPYGSVSTIRFWDAETGERRQGMRPPGETHGGIAASSDGSVLAFTRLDLAASPGGALPYTTAITLVDARTFQTESVIHLRRRRPENPKIRFTPDGEQMVATSEGHVWVIDRATGNVIKHLTDQRISIFAGFDLSPDGTLVALRDRDRILLWDWEQGGAARSFDAKESGRNRVLFSTDGRLLYHNGDAAGRVGIWEVATGKPVRQFRVGRYLGGMAVSPHGTVLAVGTDRSDTDEPDGVVSLRRPWDGKEFRSIHTPFPPGLLAFSPDGRRLAVANGTGIVVYDVATGEPVGGEPEGHYGEIKRVRFLPDDRIVTQGEDGTVRIWDGTTGRQTHMLPSRGGSGALAITPDGGKLAAFGVSTDSLRVWDTRTGELLHEVPGEDSIGRTIRMAEFTKDGGRILTHGHDLVLRVWDLSEGKEISSRPIRPAGVTVPDRDKPDGHTEFYFNLGPAVCLPGGDRLLLAFGEKVYLYDIATGKQLREFSAGVPRVESLVVTPDGGRVLFGGQGPQRKVLLFQAVNLADGDVVFRRFVPGAFASVAAVSPDGSLYAAACGDWRREVRVWDATTGREVARIEDVPDRIRALDFDRTGRRLLVGLADTTAVVYEFARP